MNERLKKALDAQKRITEIGFNICKTDPWVPMMLANPTQQYKYELSYGAVMEVFQATGLMIPLQQITPSQIAQPEVFEALILAGLRTHHADEFGTNQECVMDLMRRLPIKHYAYYTSVIHAAMQATEPDIEEIEQITSSMQDDQAPLDLQPDNTSNGFGPAVVFTESKQ